VEAYVNLSGVAVGSFVAPVMIVPPADTRVARSSPREVAGRLDVVESASLPVRAAVTGLPANAVVRVRAVPDAVTVTGARSRLAEAAYALVIAGPESTTARVTAVDADGSPVEGLNLRPASVRLMREERAALAERTLPIALARAPAGLTYRRFTLSVDQVRVVGPPNVVEGLASIVARPATAVQAGTVRVQLRLELPAGVTSLDPPPTATLVVATSD